MKENNSEALLNEELNNLRNRAQIAGYKNKIPVPPQKRMHGGKVDHLMVGFSMRLDNWKKGLVQLETQMAK